MAKNLDPKNYCTLYLVRHGESQWNKKGLIQGHKGSDLSQLGIKQAKQACQRLKGIKFDAVFSSDLARAKHTAEIITLEHQLTVKTRKALRERSFGTFEGKSKDEFNNALKDLLTKLNKKGYEFKYSYQFPHGIESIESTVIRFIRILRQISLAHIGKTVLVVNHGGLMRHLLVHLGYGAETELGWGAVDNCAHIKLLCDGVDFFIQETHGINKKNA